VLFLDTAAQGERLFGSRWREFAALVRRHKARTSTYVWEEFRCTFLRDAVMFHQLLAEEGWSVPDALRRSERYPPAQPRRQQRIRQVCYKLLEEGSAEDIRDRLELLIEGVLESRFWHRISGHDVARETGCVHGGPPPRREGATYRFDPSCATPKPPPCAIREFWEAHEAELAAIADGAEHLPDDMQVAVERAAAIRAGTRGPHGETCHVHLADCVIATEASPDDEILTTDLKHFRPICALIGRKLYEPAS
jgi:hypothetical protein